jgi:hypothetical protein
LSGDSESAYVVAVAVDAECRAPLDAAAQGEALEQIGEP